MHYQRASCQEETEADPINGSSAGFLPGPPDLFSLRNLLFPQNEEPSRLSGLTVNICTSILGQTHTPQVNVLTNKMKFETHFLPLFAGVLVCVFCVVAVQGGFQIWALAVLVFLAVVCFVITLLIWQQPESMTKLSFKVKREYACTHRVSYYPFAVVCNVRCFRVFSQVPLLPFLPVLSMFINVYLMMQLGKGTWMRFAIWMVIGKLVRG